MKLHIIGLMSVTALVITGCSTETNSNGTTSEGLLSAANVRQIIQEDELPCDSADVNQTDESINYTCTVSGQTYTIRLEIPDSSLSLMGRYWSWCQRISQDSPLLIGVNWVAESDSNVMSVESLKNSFGGKISSYTTVCPIIDQEFDDSGNPWKDIYDRVPG